MTTISTSRASYQKPNINIGQRQPTATKQQRQILTDLAFEADRSKQATTQAAFAMRIARIKSLVKAL